MAEGKKHAVALGIMTMSSEEMYYFSFFSFSFLFINLFHKKNKFGEK